MRRRFGWLGGLLTLAWFLPAPAVDNRDAKDEPSEKPARLGEVVAKLTHVEGAQKYLTVQITQKYVVPNPQADFSNGLNLLWRQQEILRNPNPVVRRQQLLQLIAEQQRNQLNAYQVREVPVNVELQATDDLKVRILQPPVDFDEKGRPRRYTAKELKDLKGPDIQLPGYTGDFDNLKPGQTVQVSLARKKDALKKPVAKDKEKDPPNEDRLLATMIVILQEAPR
jgi:hypothetical protein